MDKDLCQRVNVIEGLLAKTLATVEGHIKMTENRDEKLDVFCSYLEKNQSSMDELMEAQKWLIRTAKVCAYLGGIITFFWVFIKELIFRK
jgi:hypothetical protein